MKSPTDQELLREYAGSRSETAFAELVRRHVDFVYSAALQIVHNATQAQDVTQEVFVVLARNASQLTARSVLSGWLHRTAQNIAANVVRSDVRRRAREHEAAIMTTSEAEVPWEEITPSLDAALGELNESDRDALLLRYFERKSAAEIAQIFGLSNEAAQKRVSRAVERLRNRFAKRKLAVGAGTLAAMLSASAVESAPSGLSSAITAQAAQATALLTATQLIAMTTTQKILVTTVLASLLGTTVFEARQTARLRAQNDALVQEMQILRVAQQDATNRLASLVAENAALHSNQNFGDILRLRGQVGQLQQQLQGLPATRVALLKQKLEARPKLKIPELSLLSEKDWEKVAWNADLDSDDGIRVALSLLRHDAMETFLNDTRPALKKYLAANNDFLPVDLLPLEPYYSVPVTDDMLQRYAFIQTGTLNSNLSESVIRSVGAVDDDYDSSQQMSMNGGGGNTWNAVRDDIGQAAMAYAMDNNGQMPTDPSQIVSYLKKSIDPDTIQKYLGDITATITAYHPSLEITELAPAFKAYAAANNGQFPNNPSALQPYITTPEQQAAFQKVKQSFP